MSGNLSVCFSSGQHSFILGEINPVKIIKAYLAILAFAICFNSCTSADGSSVNNPLPKNEKEKRVVAKNKKKKEPARSKEANKKTIENRTAKKVDESPVVKNAAVDNMAGELNAFAVKNNYSEKYCFLIDMSISSGRNRFFVYDFEKNSIILSGLVAHGSCNETFLSRPRFSNEPKCGCSSLGKYKVGEFYHGKYGKSYKLYGLDRSNSNAYERAVVIHAYDCVPDKEIYPMVLCNSQGCPMVSYTFFDKLSRIINKADKPILLWIYQ